MRTQQSPGNPSSSPYPHPESICSASRHSGACCMPIAERTVEEGGASGGYNCSKAPKMELAVTYISWPLTTARYICLLLWHFLISSCNQQQQLPGTTAAPTCSHYVTSSTKEQLQLSSYNCSQLRRPPQSSSYTC